MIIWKLRGKFRPDGALWMIYVTLYATMRFGVQFLRLDEVKFWGLQQAHFLAIIVVIVTVPWMIRYMRRRVDGGPAGDSGDEPPGSRPSRRRRRRRATA
jgi:prolipoprotein diacylglyceryltransferase